MTYFPLLLLPKFSIMKNILTFCILSLFMFGFVNAQTSNVKEDAALHTLGATSGLLVYQTYMVIGAVADGHNAEAYTKETVNTLMDEQIASCTNINDSYQKLLASGFLTSKGDQDYVRELMATISVLKEEATALKAYVNNSTDANVQTYQKARTQAWDLISKLLGFDE